MTGVSIKHAVYEDLPVVADIHVKVWQQAYVGQIEQCFIDKLDPASRLKGWQQGFLKHKDDSRYGLLLADAAGHMKGFLSYGLPRDESFSGKAEIYALYVLQDSWSKGLGYRLFKAVQDIFKQQGHRQSCLWVLDTNHKAIEAYRRWGGEVHENITKDHIIGTQPVKEICVTFEIQASPP